MKKNYATVTTDNKALERVIAKEFEGSRVLSIVGDTAIHIRYNGNELHEKLTELSRRYKSHTITSRQTLQGEMPDKIYTIDFKGGVSNQIKVEYNYLFKDFQLPDGYDNKDIKDRILHKFLIADNYSKQDNKDRRQKKTRFPIDSGLNYDDVLLDMVTVKLDDHYIVEATLENSLITIEVYRKNTKWEKLSQAQ